MCVKVVAAPPHPALIHAPVTLLPSLLDRDSYVFTASLSHSWNRLIDTLARDEAFLEAQLAASAKSDEWLAGLLNVMKRVREWRETQPASKQQKWRLGILRSDYMIHEEEVTEEEPTDATVAAAATTAAAGNSTHSSPRIRYTPQQIELNTIASSFGCLSSKVSQMHAFVASRCLGLTAAAPTTGCGAHAPVQLCKCDSDCKCPQRRWAPYNDARCKIAGALAAAVSKYRTQYPSSASSQVVLMITQANESNAVDQRLLEYALWEQHRIPVIRLTLAEVQQFGGRTQDGELTLTVANAAGGRSSVHTVAVAYFRAGYTPRDYPTSAEWDALYTLEASAAIMCPTVSMHLAGSKKIQQVLTLPGVLERYLPPQQYPGEADRLRRTFTGIYAIDRDDATTQSLFASVYADPSSWVLKPQREGGGNNLWGEEMVHKLKTMTVDERAAFILMKRIRPRARAAALLRAGEIQVVECVSELGIYSSFLSDGVTFDVNECCGHLLRTKPVGVDEGGVAAGFSCLSSVAFE